MNYKTTSYKYKSLLLGLVVLFFAFTLKVSVNSLCSFLIADSMVCVDANADDGQNIRMYNVADNNEDVNSIDVKIKEVKKLSVSSFLLMDFDDLDFSFAVSSNSSRNAFFFQDVTLNYSSFVYKNVKLFLFYSFIKIPSVSL